VRFDQNGLASLDDIWIAAGFRKNQKPQDWAHLSVTHSKIEQVLKIVTGKSRNYTKDDIQRALRIRRGPAAGTYADVRLALDYAEYLSPKLAIEVKETFLRFKAADPTLADEVLNRASPEANEWAARRAMARAVRIGYTRELGARGVAEPKHYAECTNVTYRALFNKTAGELKEEKGLSKNQNLRDRMALKELAFVAAAEALSVERMEEEDSRGFPECRDATHKAGSAIHSAIEGDRRDRQRRLV
jgi:hypothetical protein